MLSELLVLLQQQRAIAAIRSPALEWSLAMARAAAVGGMRLIEITWNSDRPAATIQQLREELPHCIVGAGTILTLDQLQSAIACGSQFGFAPHTSHQLLEAAVAANFPLIPGALSPTEIVAAWQGGASCVKVFPVQAVGGASYIRDLQGPLSQIPLIASGGVTLENASQLLEAGALAVILSRALFPPSLVASKDWQGISQLAYRLQQELS